MTKTPPQNKSSKANVYFSIRQKQKYQHSYFSAHGDPIEILLSAPIMLFQI